VTTTQPRRGARLLARVHLGQAVVLLAQPPGVLRRITGDYGVPPAWIVRVLGARILIQAVAEAVSPSRNILRVGLVVDLTHAASMLAAAQVWPRYRRAALASAGGAGASIVAGALLVRARADDSRRPSE
jgi:hypothetical protein